MLMTVASFTEPWEAHLFRTRLEAEGIAAFVAHEHHVWAAWPYALALGGVKVQVLRGDWEVARAVERRCQSGEYAAALAAVFEGADDTRCPACGSAEFTSRRSLLDLVMLALFLQAGFSFPWRRAVHGCATCGTSWRDRAMSPR